MGGLFVAIIVVAVVIFILKPSSFNVDVGISVLRAMSSVAIMSLGLLLVIVVGEIDLSFGAMYGLGANALAVMWIMWGIPDYVALPLAIAIGGVVGLFNGPARHRPPHPVLHRHARELQPPLRRLAVDHQDLDLQPGLSAAGRRRFPRAELNFFTGMTASYGAHPISLEVLLDAGARGRSSAGCSTARCSASG